MTAPPREKGTSQSSNGRTERIYWRFVNLPWVLLVLMILLAMRLLLGPEFWREFFK